LQRSDEIKRRIMVEADQSEIAGPHSEADQIVLKIHSHELRSFFPNYSDQIAHKPPVFPNIYGLLTQNLTDSFT
jgi:hypothetical protein